MNPKNLNRETGIPGLIKVCGLSFIVILLLVAGDFRFARAEHKDSEINKLVIGNDTDSINHSEVDMKSVRAAWDLLGSEMLKKTGLKAEHFFYDDLNSLVKDFNNDKIDVISTSALNYLNIADRIEEDFGFTTIVRGKATHQYLVLTRSNSDIAGITDLKDKKLIIKKEDKTGRFFLDATLLQNGLEEADKFFRSIAITRTFVQAILSTFFGKAEICIAPDTVFKTMIELNPQVGKRLRVVHSSPDIINSVFVFRKNYDEKAKKTAVREIMHMKDTSYGKQLFMLYKIEDIVLLKESQLDTLKSFMNNYKELKLKNK
ncbi:MAG: phosphate/phosphite/phosphonate ABC transporter substrate-binding protein [Desulfobacteraceae bacterium]|nr:phosphate/phosphite/phosphonate ABC transporter substrate-binding protein [Desulfobacteraceae bacterium]